MLSNYRDIIKAPVITEKSANIASNERKYVFKVDAKANKSQIKDAIEKIEAVLLIQIKVTVKYEEFLNVVFSQIWGEEEKNKKCKKAVFEYIKIIERILKEGIEKGEIYDGNVEVLASGIFGTTCSSLIYRLKRNREVDVKEIYEGFRNTVVSALDARKKM